jgi:hypothetical protein
MGGTQPVCGRREICTRPWWENVKERKHLEDPGVDNRIIILKIR